MSSFTQIAKKVAEKYKVDYEMMDDSESVAYIGLNPPLFVKKGDIRDNLITYYFDTLLGKVVDETVFPAIDLLFMNNKRDSMFAIRSSDAGNLLVLKARIVIPNNLDDDKLVGILMASMVTDFHLNNWNFPGVEKFQNL